MIDRNKIGDQLLRNPAMLGLRNVEHACRIRRLIELQKNDYRGTIVTMIPKFNDMPANICKRSLRFTGFKLKNYLHFRTFCPHPERGVQLNSS
jgi:type I restriction enzyme R subunit